MNHFHATGRLAGLAGTPPGLSAVTAPAVLAAAAAHGRRSQRHDEVAGQPAARTSRMEQAPAATGPGPHNPGQRRARLADHTHRRRRHAPRGRASRDRLPGTGHQIAPDRSQRMTRCRGRQFRHTLPGWNRQDTAGPTTYPAAHHAHLARRN
jgi:hypothetical protein